MNYFDIKIRLFTANSVVLFEVQTARIHMLKLEYFLYHKWTSNVTGKHPRRSGLHYKRRRRDVCGFNVITENGNIHIIIKSYKA